MYGFLRFIPKNHLSWLVGTLVHLPLPRPLATRLIRRFARAFDIDTEAASRPLESYRSIGEFFTRDLREGLRPVGPEPVSPVDGKLRDRGPVVDGRIVQVKGRTYPLVKFLGEDADASRFEGGFYFNLYLSPRDYHHIHSPVSGEVVRCTHIPGKLWPVNDWSIGAIENLFAVNERVVVWIRTERFGLVAVAMIGATNVGKITVTFDDIVSNARRTKDPMVRDYRSPKPVSAGDRLGTFHMGSSVVVLFEPGRVEESAVAVRAGDALLYGQPLTGR